MTDKSAFLAAILADPCNIGIRAVYADWLEEEGDDEALRMRSYIAEELYVGYGKPSLPVAVPAELQGGDWQEAFAYAGGELGSTSGAGTPVAAVPSADIDLSPFGRQHVNRVIACSEGNNDGPNWICVGQLWDGRFFSLNAGCDYTGWD